MYRLPMYFKFSGNNRQDYFFCNKVYILKRKCDMHHFINVCFGVISHQFVQSRYCLINMVLMD